MNRNLIYPITFLLLIISCNNKTEIIPSTQYLDIFPNPATDYVDIIVSEIPNNQTWTLKMFDPKAEVIFESNSALSDERFRIDLTNKPKGNYYIVLQAGSVTKRQKLIKA